MPDEKKGIWNSGKLFGRTFGVQSLREVAVSFERFPLLRKAYAGGAAVALAVSKNGLYPNACFLGNKNQLVDGFSCRSQPGFLTLAASSW
ncbi:MAG: hypothetical protein V4454_12240 [Pseudomonadota bacterium]